MISTLNNEAMGLVAIQSVLMSTPRISVANSYLIVPLLFDKKIRSYLKRKGTNVLSAQELITSHSEHFIGFNEKFADSLITSTNAIAMGLELKILMTSDNNLILNEPIKYKKKIMGKKVDEFFEASINVSKVLSESPDTLYSLLRIEI